MDESSIAPHRIDKRFLDANLERLNVLTPLHSLALEPDVSLKEAVHPFRDRLYEIDTYVWTAIERSKTPSGGLSSDESAAIILYTIEWNPPHPSLYTVLNETLRHEDRKQLISWRPYLKLLLTALFKLPSTACTIYRGVNGDVGSKYGLNEPFTWWAFSSCTQSMEVLARNKFLDESGPGTLFIIDCLNGKSIDHHSYFQSEDETLLLPCAHFQVTARLYRPDSLSVIHLREIHPPHMLLEPPFKLSTEFTAKQNECEQCRTKAEEIRSMNERIKQEKGQLEEKLQALTADNQRINGENRTLCEEMQRLNDKVSQLTADNAQINGNNRVLKDANEHLEAENLKLKAENEQRINEEKHAKQENLNLQREMDEVKKQLVAEVQKREAYVEFSNQDYQRLKREWKLVKNELAKRKNASIFTRITNGFASESDCLMRDD